MELMPRRAPQGLRLYDYSYDPDAQLPVGDTLTDLESLTETIESRSSSPTLAESATGYSQSIDPEDVDVPIRVEGGYNSDPDNKTVKFTVERRESLSEEVVKPKKKSSWLSSICKVFATGLLSVGLLLCVVASKLSVVSIASHLTYYPNSTRNFTCNSATSPYSDCKEEIAFVMLVLILLVPQCVSFLRSMWASWSRCTHPWPSRNAIFWGIVGSTLEVAGLTLFVIGVLSIIKTTDVAIALMNSMFLIPVMWQIGKECRSTFGENEILPPNLEKKRKQSRFRNISLSFIALIFLIGGLGGIIYQARIHTLSITEIICIPLAIALISFSWCPKLRKLQIEHDLDIVFSSEGNEVEGGTLKTATNGVGNGHPPGEKKKRKLSADKMVDDSRKIVIETNTSRGKATILNSLFKIILTPLFAGLLCYVFKLANVSRIDRALSGFFSDSQLYGMFLTQVLTSYVGYYIAWLACTVTLQRICFAFPLTLATPLSIIIVVSKVCDDIHFGPCVAHTDDMGTKSLYIVLLGAALWLGQFFSTTYYAWKNQDFIMADEALLFWIPHYDGALLEQSLLLNRKNEATNEHFINYRQLVKKTSIYICTTMYHEADFEMEQLLHSIAGIDAARQDSGRRFETHLFFDDGVRGKVLKRYALQLLSLLGRTVKVDIERCTRLTTPYGMQLLWKLQGGMKFFVHLKDNVKVKNKKRWSQVMYMSYVLDFRERGTYDHAYILTTDADVRFSPEDVMALMDRMSRDPNVGAVCGRTHPLGSGPLVWYQIFDYAIGHWLLKVAEHVLGSVLCSPGCFSVYRVRAIRDILPTYATHVECAMDFLTKDMGEDRWLCTLMVESGWRLEYSAAAENSTYCPDNFDEFFKQRRRWGPSTLANQVLMIQRAAIVRRNNDQISLFFIIYNVLMLISTLIGPANTILIISSGLNYAFPSVDLYLVFSLVCIITGVFIYVCLKFKQDVQLKLAKLLTFFFSMIMTITLVGLMSQVADDIKTQTALAKPLAVNTTHPPSITNSVTFSGFALSPSTLYLLLLMFIFVATALFHGKEGMILIHGIWYLLCLPSGYLFLTIYSVANMTDRSWGTREGKTASTSSGPEKAWHEKLLEKLEKICVCCRRQPPQPRAEAIVIEDNMSDIDSIAGSLSNHSVDSAILTDSSIAKQGEGIDSDDDVLSDDGDETQSLLSMEPKKKVPPPVKPKSRRVKFASGLKFQSFKTADGQLRLQPLAETFQRSASVEHNATFDITEWLQGHYKQYVENFKDNGYDDTTFLVGLKEQDLLDIGITNRGHRKKLCLDIDQLPPEEIDQEVPDNVREWLIKIGLESYWPSFRDNSYTEPNALADLKFMNKSTIQVTFGMSKEGHVKKLSKAVKQLQYPSAAERRIRRSRVDIEKSAVFTLESTNPEEHRFWERLRRVCLLPEQAAFNSSGELKEHLQDLRDTSLVGLAVSNILWLTVMVALISQGKKLQIFNTNFLGLGFLFVYTMLVVLQFITLIFHRVETWVHVLARTPFTPGQGMHLNWSFNDEDLPRDPTKEELLEMQRRISSKVSRKSNKNKSRKSRKGDEAEAMRRRRRHMQYANYVDYDGSVAMSF